MILDRLDIDVEAFAAGTGWAIMPEGACKREVCIPLPRGLFDLADTAGDSASRWFTRWHTTGFCWRPPSLARPTRERSATPAPS